MRERERELYNLIKKIYIIIVPKLSNLFQNSRKVTISRI